MSDVPDISSASAALRYSHVLARPCPQRSRACLGRERSLDSLLGKHRVVQSRLCSDPRTWIRTQQLAHEIKGIMPLLRKISFEHILLEIPVP